MVPTYNEEENVIPLCEAVREEFAKSLPQYDYEIVFIDNCSTDTTREKLSALCSTYQNVRAIFNVRNFGQFNSPYHGICQTQGDCTIPLCADFQDPIEMIPQLVAKWEEGYKVICAVKTASRENKLVRFLRTCYYKMIRKMSSVEQIEHFTGFGLYDRSFVDVLRTLDDPTPFIRGIVAELGFAKTEIPYTQAKRRAGKTHNNFGTLYDAAMLSFTTYTKTPLRFFTMLGGLLLGASFVGAAAMLVLLLLEVKFSALLWFLPLIVGCTSLQLLSIGMVGEYILTLRSKIMRRPIVVEEKRLNFGEEQK
jgi:glycosyltransferase involved in cell wall biosynthesis